MADTHTLSATDFTVPTEDRHFEDYLAGAVHEYGYVSVTEQEIIEFARAYDPQRMHVDPEFAAGGPYGGIIASGWQSAGLLMRLFVAHYLPGAASLGSPGAEEIHWAVPLRPGDVLKLRTTTEQTRPSKSKPDRGLVITKAELFNADGGCPVSLRAVNLVATRPRGAV
jgi:acyl dehydratase